MSEKWTIDQLEQRAAFLRANAHRHPDQGQRENLYTSAGKYEKAAKRKRRLRVAGWSVAGVSVPTLLLAPSVYAGWAGLGAEMLVGGIGGPLAIGVLAYESLHLLTWLEARRPQHESARIAEAKYGDREPEPAPPPRRPSPRPRPSTTVIDGEVVSR